MQLMNLLPKMRAERGIAILQSIFSDKKVLKALGAAKQLSAASITGGKPPQELLEQMKEGLGGHIKDNAFGYEKMIKMELARIMRI